MRKVKNYQEFTNEEINIRKALVGAALGASVLGGMTSCNKEDIKPKIELSIKQNLIKGSWETTFKFWTTHEGDTDGNNFTTIGQFITEEEIFYCKIDFDENGRYSVSNRKNGSTVYPSIIEGTYEIIENYSFDYGSKGTALILNNLDNSYNVIFRVSENPSYTTVNPGGKYYLSKEGSNWELMNKSILIVLGVNSEVVYDPHSVENQPVEGITSQGISYEFPDIEIVKK
jgi:hypothetical protein